MRNFRFLACLGALLAVSSVGCSTGDAQPVGSGESALLPPHHAYGEGQMSLFELAEYCDGRFTAHRGIRHDDLRDGVIRWGCGDVPGVTGPDRGQEYCEYHALSNGKIVDGTPVDELDVGSVSCVFTSVYTDVRPEGEVASYVASLSDMMSSEKNLSIASEEIEPLAIKMQLRANQRTDATLLLQDCVHATTGTPSRHPGQADRSPLSLLNERRQAACYQASTRPGAAKAALKAACLGKDLSNEANWAVATALNAVVQDNPTHRDYDHQSDIAACLATRVAAGVTFRNSDPMICARAFRAANECGVDFNPLPPTLDGFTFTGWSNRQLPANCRYAKKESAGVTSDYQHLVICTPDEVGQADMQSDYAEDLRGFCNDRYAQNIVMMAPLRAVQKPREGMAQNKETPFCRQYFGLEAYPSKMGSL